MHGRRALAVLALVALTVVTSQAAGPLSPDNDYLTAVWVAESKGVLKLAASDGRTLCELPDRKGADAVAVDEKGAVLWVYGDDHLKAYSFGCAALSDTRVNLHDESVTLAVHQRDGSVWLGAKRRLFRFDAAGKLKKEFKLRDELRGLAVDAKRARVWLAGERTVSQLTEEGKFVREIRLARHEQMRALELDPTTGSLWLATHEGVMRLNEDGTRALTVPFHHTELLSADNAGGLWLASERSVQHVAADGRITISFEPFDHRRADGRIAAMEADLSNNSVWVAGHQALAQYDEAGNLLRRFDNTQPDHHRHHHHHEFGEQIRALALYSDRLAPDLTITAPPADGYVNSATPEFKLAYSDEGIGVDTATLKATQGDNELPLTCEFDEEKATCRPASPLSEGKAAITFTIKDFAGNSSEEVTHQFTVDTVAPIITVTTPSNGAYTNNPTITLAASVSEYAEVSVNGESLFLNTNNAFSREWPLTEGANSFTIAAMDRAGNPASATVTVNLDTVVPGIPDLGKVHFTVNTDGTFTVTGEAGSVESGARVLIRNKRTGELFTVYANADGSFSAKLNGVAGDSFELVAEDSAQNQSEPVEAVTGPKLPPDPATIAPALDPTRVTPMYEAVSFLFSGSNPIQQGVAEGTIEARRVAVLRGRVLDRNSNPVTGVEITIKDHPEFGSTLTRADGAFDMAVNGGGYVTVQYMKKDYLPVQRQSDTPWADWMSLPDVVMIQLDPQVTAIDLNGSAPMQVAQGSTVTDADGTRQATLLFPQGIQAQMRLPDGTLQPLSTLHVRATEYTVGDNGPKAMPGPLPSTSAYTYAVELSVDEAIDAGAREVLFSGTVPFYLDNFLDFPVGEIVPLGYYDPARSAWVPSDNGLIVKILSVSGGLAELDVSGSGQAATAEELAALGITEEERAQLARLYGPGKSLWRMPVTHFSPWDGNFPFFFDMKDLQAVLDWLNQKLETPPKTDDPNECPGCIIEAENQLLGERIPVTGTPFTLNYRSDRVRGHAAERMVEIPVTGASVPASLSRVDLEIKVAGQIHRFKFPAEPNQSTSFIWDGKDAFGRPYTGEAKLSYTLSYVYRPVYVGAKNVRAAFAQVGDLQKTMRIDTGDNIRAGNTVAYYRTFTTPIFGSVPDDAHLGHWTLSEHHSYNMPGANLYRGDGSREQAAKLVDIVETFAGGGTSPLGDGGPATEAALSAESLAVGPDGSLYILSTGRIRKVGIDGIITTVAGGGTSHADGIPATAASLGAWIGLAFGPDGSIYVVDSGKARIRRITPDGIINTVAGTGANAPGGMDGVKATESPLFLPKSIAVAPDGTLFIGEYTRVRRVGPDGLIHTHAAVNAFDLEYGPDGALYAADGNAVRRIGADGTITRVASGGFAPHSVAISRDGTLYLAASGAARVIRVATDGAVSTLVGTGKYGFSGDGGPASQAQMGYSLGLALSPEGHLYFADPVNRRVRIVHPQFKGQGGGEVIVASDDGSEFFSFTPIGRHLETRDTVTGALSYAAAYTRDGYLANLRDAEGNTTVIERDPTGKPLAIVSPDGQRTTLTLDPNGYLASVTNPAGETIGMTYTPDGLLTSYVKSSGAANHYEYDALGRLEKDAEEGGGGWLLDRVTLTNGFETVMTSAEGRTSRYLLQQVNETDSLRKTTAPDGTSATRTVTTTDTAVTETAVSNDGTSVTQRQEPDPRFGMDSLHTTAATVTTPSGLKQTMTASRDVVLANKSDLLSIVTFTESATLNQRSSQSVYTAANRRWTSTSAEGRVETVENDALGRPALAQFADITPVQYEYDERGRLKSVAQGTGAEARTTALTYDPQGNLKTITDALNRSAGFEYDLAGRVTKQTFPDGRAVSYTYDPNGNLASLTPPGRTAHVFEYTPVDQEAAYTPPPLDGVDTITRYTYNLDKQLTRIARPDGKAVGLDYDTGGRLSAVNFSRGQVGYAYHPTTGQLAGITAPSGPTLSYTWDGFLPLSESMSGEVAGTVSRTYDNNFWVKSLAVNDQAVEFAYDNDGLLTQAGGLTLARDPQNGLLTGTTLGAVTTHREYSAFGELKSEEAKVNGNTLFATRYLRDALGRITEKTETVEGLTTTTAYHYDLAGRLDEVKTNGQITAAYTYDANGNRLSKTTPTGQETGTYDTQDRMLTYAGASYEYTANGELKSKTENGATTHYVYDELGNLVQVRLPGDVIIDYVIDGRNRRVGKKVNGRLVQGFLYQDQLEPVAELDGDGNVVARFIYGSKGHAPDYMEKNGKNYRVVTDHLGSPRQVIDVATGEVVQRMDFDEFGNVTLDTNPGFQPFGFAGGSYDQHTELTRFGARDYEADSARWTSKDPVGFDGGDADLYSYVEGDPINLIDPYGLCAENQDPNDIWKKIKESTVVDGNCVSVGGGPSICAGPGTLRNKPGSLGKSKGTDALRRENRAPRDAAKEAGLTKDQQRELHDAISGQDLTYQKILEIAKDIANGRH